jgi:MFS family permease
MSFTIVGFGFSKLTSQLLTAPPCLIATIGVLLGGYLAGKYNRRSPLLVGGSFIVGFGYLFLLLLHDKWGKNDGVSCLYMYLLRFSY